MPDRRLLCRFATTVLGGGLAYWMSVLLELRQFWLGIVPAVLYIGTQVGELFVSDALAGPRHPRGIERIRSRLRRAPVPARQQLAEHLTDAICTLRACEAWDVSVDLQVKAGIAGPAGAPEKPVLVQVASSRGQAAGREGSLSPAHCGPIGRSLRAGQPVSASFADAAECAEWLLTECGCTLSGAGSAPMAVRSFHVEPIWADGEVVGVVRFMSPEPQVFPLAIDRPALTRVLQRIALALKASELLGG